MVQPIIRNAGNMLKAPVSILKRPQSPTPFPFHATFSVLVSPRSPHVQFPASPNLVATFTTHSSEMYDRAPIKVSPNPLAMPARGDRIFSPSLENFTLAAPPKRSKVKARLNNKLVLELSEPLASPAITEFADPRSPKPHAKSSKKAAPPPLKAVALSNHVQFAEPARPERSLSHSLSSFPRSPYPTAPIGSPVPAGAAELLRSRGSSSKSSKSLSVSSPVSLSFGQALSAKPSTSGLKRQHKPAPLPLEPPAPSQESSSKLVDAFWKSVTLEGETPMVTALEYPASADLVDVDLKSPAPVAPSLTFGAADGSIWSPRAANPSSAPFGTPKSVAMLSTSNLKAVPARESLLRAALLSPGVKSTFGGARALSTRVPLRRAEVTAPSPHDPYASFQSFAAAMSTGFGDLPRSVDQADALIAYPAPVATAA